MVFPVATGQLSHQQVRSRPRRWTHDGIPDGFHLAFVAPQCLRAIVGESCFNALAPMVGLALPDRVAGHRGHVRRRAAQARGVELVEIARGTRLGAAAAPTTFGCLNQMRTKGESVFCSSYIAAATSWIAALCCWAGDRLPTNSRSASISCDSGDGLAHEKPASACCPARKLRRSLTPRSFLFGPRSPCSVLL